MFCSFELHKKIPQNCPTKTFYSQEEKSHWHRSVSRFTGPPADLTPFLILSPPRNTFYTYSVVRAYTAVVGRGSAPQYYSIVKTVLINDTIRTPRRTGTARGRCLCIKQTNSATKVN